MKKVFNLDVFVATVIMFAVMAIVQIIPFNLNFLDPIFNSISDFEVNDIVFSKLRSNYVADTNIVLVNIGHLKRGKILEQVDTLIKYQPRVIAIDAFFRRRNNQEDSLLLNEFLKIRKLVLVSNIINSDRSQNSFDSLYCPIRENGKGITTGFANLITDDKRGFRTVRKFCSYVDIKDRTEMAFPVEIIRQYDPNLFDLFIKRQKKEETINYRGNYDKFYTFDTYNFSDSVSDFSIVKDKIVLMGFLGEKINDTLSLEDKFFTPLNFRYAGKTYPDMYGMVIHANIISMILNKEYINSMSPAINFFIAVMVSYLNLLGFWKLRNKYDIWWEGISNIFLLIETIIFLIIDILVFDYLCYEFDSTFIIIAILFAPNLLQIYTGTIKREFLKNFYRIMNGAKDHETIQHENI